MRISARHQKILGSVQQRKLIRGCCSERALFWVCPLTQKFSAIPAAIFALPIDIEKLINVEGLFLVKLARTSIQDSMGCCTIQLSLVYNRVCWDFVWAASGFSVLKNGPRGLRIFRGILGGPGGWPGWFLRGFGGPGAREGSFGVTKPKRDILVAV